MAELTTVPAEGMSPEQVDELSARVRGILGPGGVFAEKIQGFTPREAQLDLALAVTKTLSSGGTCIAEAGTGTGKTFAYLIPALLSGKVTVVSTASKALQDQLMYKDLPRLFHYLGLKPEFMVLKGFANYLCLRRAQEFIHKYGAGELLDDRELLKPEQLALRKTAEKVEALIRETDLRLEKRDPLCDYAEVNSKFAPEIVSQLTLDHKLCRLFKNCPFATHCYPIMARNKATASRLVIVNHALFFASLSIDDVFDPQQSPFMLPKYRHIIFDEAHELPAIGRNFLSEGLSLESVDLLEQQLQVLLELTPEMPRNEVSAAMFAVRNSFNLMFQYLKGKLGKHADRRDFLSLIYEDFDPGNTDPTLQYHKPCADFISISRKMYRSLRDFKDFLRDNMELNPELVQPLSDHLSDLMRTLRLLMTLNQPDNEEYGTHVGSCSLHKHDFEFKLTPLEISAMFGGYLKLCSEHQLGVVLTSATVSVNQSCQKFRRDLGAPAQTAELIVKSHFNYPQQAALYVSEEFPSPQDEDRMDKILLQLRPLLDATSGGIFILTTSVAAVKRAAEILEGFRLGRQILRQYHEMSNTRMLQAFKEDGRAILIGTSSFWAGVDVPGPALSLVIIDKLPFDPPDDPLLKARFNWYDFKAGRKKSFHDLYLPEAVINLRQGVGRLVRSDADTGVMVICDPRLLSKGYGKIFLNSLPPMRRCQTLSETLTFLKKVENSHE